MSWYQENKFAATILGITAVASGALVYLGMSANSDAAAANQKEKAAVDKINKLQAAKPYPNEENRALLADGVASFAADTKKFQDTLLKFRPEELRKLSANEFSGEVSQHTRKLTKYFKGKKIALPEDKVYFGMEDYATTMASESSTRILSYQRQALDWLFTSLADSGVDKLENVHRAKVEETLGKAPAPAAKPKKRRKRAPKVTALTSVYDGLPIEITFTGTEASLQDFMTKVAAGDEYFFAIKMIKISNEEQDPVTISKATFAPVVEPALAPEEGVEEGAEEIPDGAFEDGFGLGGGEEFDLEVDKEIIKQVIGDEKITVFMQLELILYKDAASVTIPGLKQEKPLKVAPKKVPTKVSTK